MKELLARGADIEAEDSDGITALFYVDQKNPELTDFFVKQGARTYIQHYSTYK